MGRLAAGTVHVEPVQLKDDPFSFQTYDVGLLLQVAARGGDAEPSVTDGDAGVIEVQADSGNGPDEVGRATESIQAASLPTLKLAFFWYFQLNVCVPAVTGKLTVSHATEPDRWLLRTHNVEEKVIRTCLAGYMTGETDIACQESTRVGNAG